MKFFVFAAAAAAFLLLASSAPAEPPSQPSATTNDSAKKPLGEKKLKELKSIYGDLEVIPLPDAILADPDVVETAEAWATKPENLVLVKVKGLPGYPDDEEEWMVDDAIQGMSYGDGCVMKNSADKIVAAYERYLVAQGTKPDQQPCSAKQDRKKGGTP